MRPPFAFIRRLGAGLGVLLGVYSPAAPLQFNLPAQSVAESLVAFSRQARVEVLFSYDDLHPLPAAALVGRFEPEEALRLLLQDTGFAARRNLRGKYVVSRAAPRPGALSGRILTPAGEPASGLPVALAGTRLRTQTDATGAFTFPAVPPGPHRLFAGASGYRLLEKSGLNITAAQTLVLEPLQLQAASDITVLDPYIVTERNDRLPIGEGVGAAPRRAAGNLDLPRTEDNALPFTIFTRAQITRSGVVQLNEFLQRELLESTPSRPPEQNGGAQSYATGSSNLSLRGYEANETVVLVNGRRLPETFTAETGQLGAPDVNLVPLTLVQQIEVLPTSASALYSGNAVGGVINIVLRPDAEGTEVRTTYTNALGGYDAPQSSFSLQHGRNLLDGRLRLRLNATFTLTAPAVESELGFQRARLAATAPDLRPAATPNIQGTDPNGLGLFGPGTATFTSVAPGADGLGGLAAFQSRHGVFSTGSFDTPGGLAAFPNSRDYPYGREQRRAAWYGSVVYDLFPWLQLGLDVTYARTVVHRGYDVFTGELNLAAGSPYNVFAQDVVVALHETTPALGQDYNEARLDSGSLVAGALLKLPAGWQLSFDGQYSRNIARYRGVARADPSRWQQLVDEGRYNPLRDTQVHGPPPEFYDRVLSYFGAPGKFVTLGDYETFEGTVRATHEALPLPTGQGTLNFGTDYRLNRLAPYTEAYRFADGTPASEVIRWSGRTLERISVFGEIQAPLVPAARLPRVIKGIETDVAARYIVSTQSNETSLAPTFGLKVDLAGGFSVRGSYTTSNRFPTPIMSRPLAEGSGGGSGSDQVLLFDPLRAESYAVEAKVAINPNLRPEAAATQTAGIIWQRGKTHHFRVSLDFADTTKTNEFVPLEAQAVINLEELFPDRVQRTTPPPSGTPASPARITTVLTGAVNAARRHSQNWNAALSYTWNGFAGGDLELRGRWMWFQRYDRQIFANSPVVDELGSPDGTAPTLLRHRLTFNAGWTGPRFGFGVDGHYLGARILPASQWPGQGSDRIKAYWQFDAYAQTDLTRWLPGEPGRFRLNAQLRVNNLSDFDFPKYVYEGTGSSVQPYGDWRGRTYSFSLSASF